MPPRRHPHYKFWDKVERLSAGECWPWKGSKNHKGYGQLKRKRDGVCRRIRATHVAWEIANQQPFPNGKIACHSCDNPTCVNPAHIWPGTPADNARDRDRKGRGRLPQHSR